MKEKEAIEKIIIQDVSIEDAEELLKIYAPYILETAVSFEYEVPSLMEFKERITNISSKYPYIKAVDENGGILGYAYAASFKGRKAYDWSVETTIYLKKDMKKKGIGRALYTELERRLKCMGILNMNACIAIPKTEDEHLTMDSIYFHEKMGFGKVGVFTNSGYKFNTWYDMEWMEKIIGEHKSNQNEVHFGMKFTQK